MMSAVMPSSEAAPAAVAMASPITSMPLHLENPRVVNTRPTRQQIQKTPQASSTAAWWSRVVTVQIGPRHAVAPVTMVASQTAQNNSTGTKAHSAHRNRRGTATRSRLHGRLLSTNSNSPREFALGGDDGRVSCSVGPSWRFLRTVRNWVSILRLRSSAKPRWWPTAASRILNTVPTLPSPIR